MVASTPAPTGRIFISYRRQETAFPAAWLYDRLAEHYGHNQVFKDIDSIPLGDNFVEVITRAVESCEVLLALIGPQWLTITDDQGRRRLDNPEDFVRLEIEAALARRILVIPILVDRPKMPSVDELPDSLAELVHRQALELSPARFAFDFSRLLKVLDPRLEASRQAAQEQMWARWLDERYDEGLAAYYTDSLDQAIQCFTQVVERQPGYRDAAAKLEKARDLDKRILPMARAVTMSHNAGHLGRPKPVEDFKVEAIRRFRDYHDNRMRELVTSKDELLEDAARLHNAGQWQAVVRIGELLKALDPDAADPSGMVSSAQAKLDEARRLDAARRPSTPSQPGPFSPVPRPPPVPPVDP